MRYVCTLILILAAKLAAQDGAAIYKERCASCHDAAEGRAPKLDALKAMTGEAIFTALAAGPMKGQAAGLSTPEIFALIGFIAPTGAAVIPRSGTVVYRRCDLSPVTNLAMSPAVRVFSFAKCPKAGSANHGGIFLVATASLIALAQGRVDS